MATAHDRKAAARLFDIEKALMDIPGLEVGVAVPLRRRGRDAIGAYVVVRTGMHVSAERILAACREQLGPERSPATVVFGKEVPLTPAGEVDRAKLQSKFA